MEDCAVKSPYVSNSHKTNDILFFILRFSRKNFHEIIRNMRKSFERMLDFYGLEYTDGQVRETIYFKESLKRWCTPKNHNFLRITRILKSLKLFGLKKKQSHFL